MHRNARLNPKRKVKAYEGPKRYLVSVTLLSKHLSPERCLKCIYKMKKQYEYVRKDESGHSHFTRTVKKGPNAGKVVGCKYGASEDKGKSQFISETLSVLPEILFFSLKVKFHRFLRTFWTWAESPVLLASASPSLSLLLQKRVMVKLTAPDDDTLKRVLNPTHCLTYTEISEHLLSF